MKDASERKPLPPRKSYYSIREVADYFGYEVSKIRYWTDTFPSLKEKVGRNRAKDRVYTPADVTELELINDLVENQGFTLKGATQKLEERKKVKKSKATVDSLLDLRFFLAELLKKSEDRSETTRKPKGE